MPRFAPVTTHTVLAISLRAAIDELARKVLGQGRTLESTACLLVLLSGDLDLVKALRCACGPLFA